MKMSRQVDGVDGECGRWAMVRDKVLGRSDCTALIDPAVWAKRTFLMII